MPQWTKGKSTRLPYTPERSKLRGSHGQRPWFYCRNKDAYYYGTESAWFNAFQGGYQFQVEDGVRNLDGRTTFFYFATAITPAMEVVMVGKGSQYAIAAKDVDGNWLDGSKNYKLTLPANIPQANF